MTIQVLRRDDWDGRTRELGDCFRLHKEKSGRQMEAVCRLVSHPLGWELRLEIGGSLQQSQLCRTQDEVFETFLAWKRAMTEKEWS